MGFSIVSYGMVHFLRFGMVALGEVLSCKVRRGKV